jgi:hypothetical protein
MLKYMRAPDRGVEKPSSMLGQSQRTFFVKTKQQFNPKVTQTSLSYISASSAGLKTHNRITTGFQKLRDFQTSQGGDSQYNSQSALTPKLQTTDELLMAQASKTQNSQYLPVNKKLWRPSGEWPKLLGVQK